MALTGDAKRDYQRDYMRRRRSNVRPSVRPTYLSGSGKKRPKRREEMTAEELGITGHDADGNPLYEE